MADEGYDSTGDTLRHSLRVGTLIGELIKALVDRSTCHDLSKTEDPEKAVFDEVTPRLKVMTYGSPEYKASLQEMGSALAHHYAHNPHHPEHHQRGINGMTLVDLVEMLADWKAASERHSDGDLAKSLAIQRGRFGIEAQLLDVLVNTAYQFGWIPEPNIYEQTPAHDALRQHLYAAHHNLAALELSDAEARRQHAELHDEELWRHDRDDLSWDEQEAARNRREQGELG